jgi:hypothetical protein
VNRPDDAPDEMNSDPLIDDAYVERLLRRRGLGADGDPAGSFVAAVADLGRSAPAPTGALAVLLTEGFDPAAVTDPLTAAAAEPPAARRTGRWAGLSLAARLSVVAGVALGGLATAASAGVLPAEVQDRIGGLLEATTPFEFPPATTPAPSAPAVTPPGSPPARTEPEDGRRAPAPATDVPGTTRPTTPTVELPAVVPAPDGVPGQPAPSPSELRPGQQPAERSGPPNDVPGQPGGPSEQPPGRDRSPDNPGTSESRSPGRSPLISPGSAAQR